MSEVLFSSAAAGRRVKIAAVCKVLQFAASYIQLGEHATEPDQEPSDRRRKSASLHDFCVRVNNYAIPVRQAVADPLHSQEEFVELVATVAMTTQLGRDATGIELRMFAQATSFDAQLKYVPWVLLTLLRADDPFQPKTRRRIGNRGRCYTRDRYQRGSDCGSCRVPS